MPVQKISIQQFLQFRDQYPVLDVRSPGEYAHAHIPGACSFPLFTDEERKVVGTLYKQEGKQKAVKAGLAFFGPKMVSMVETVEQKLTEQGPAGQGAGPVIVHCWRGGMRSAGVAWLLDLYGFNVYTLTGGYKSFRRWCVQQFDKKYPFSVLGGFTGSGKTGLLKELKADGRPIIDLEALAAHKGSVFGHLGEPSQPTQEMFENRLALALAAAADATGSIPPTIWLEDESQRIGPVNIPIVLYRHIMTRPLYFLDIPFEERLTRIVKDYGEFEKDKLADGVIRLKKRLGGQEAKIALAFLETGDIVNCFRILLKYYDKYYLKSLHQKENLLQLFHKVPCVTPDAAANARILLKAAQSEKAGQAMEREPAGKSGQAGQTQQTGTL